jgi:hypothetical protein
MLIATDIGGTLADGTVAAVLELAHRWDRGGGHAAARRPPADPCTRDHDR